MSERSKGKKRARSESCEIIDVKRGDKRRKADDPQVDDIIKKVTQRSDEIITDVMFQSRATEALYIAWRQSKAVLADRKSGKHTKSRLALNNQIRLLMEVLQFTLQTKEQWHPPAELCYDALLQVFSYLKPRELAQCALTSQLWYKATNAPTLYTGQVQLEGDCESIMRQWSQVIQKRGKDVSVESLQIKHSRVSSLFDSYDQWTKFLQSLPFDTVQYIDYTGCNSKVDKAFFDKMQRSLNVRRLKFKSSVGPVHDEMYLRIALNSAITRCKLESLEIDANIGIKRVDLSNLILENLKTFKVKTPTTAETLGRYLKRVAKSIEELQIISGPGKASAHELDDMTNAFRPVDPRYTSHYTDYYKTETIKMPKLKKFHANYTQKSARWEGRMYSNGSNFMILGPSIIDLHQGRYFTQDSGLLDSCARHLKNVYLEVHSDSYHQVYKAIAKMALCEKLTLKMVTGGFRPVESGWKSVTWYHISLANLSDMILIDDNIIRGDEIVRLVENKTKTPQLEPLQSLTLQNCCRIEAKYRSKLKELVPNFNYIIEDYV